jgi:hypothetical protein
MSPAATSVLDRPHGILGSSAARSEWRWRSVVAASHLAVFAVVAYRGIFRPAEWVGPNLFPQHSALVRYAFADYWRPATPGYLFRFASQTINDLLGFSDVRVGALVTCAVAYAVFGVALYETFRRTNVGSSLLTPRWSLLASVAVALLESPAAFWGWTRFSGDRLFVPMYLPFVPTTLTALGINMFLMLAVASVVSGRMPPRRARFVPVLVVVAAVAKPTLLPVLMFAAVVVAAVDDRRTRRLDHHASRRLREVLRLVVLPGAIVLAIQLYTTIYKLQYAGEGYDDRGGWSIVPLKELRQLHALTPLFFAVFLWPVVALLIFRRRLLSDRSVLLVYVAMVPAVAMALLLARDGYWKGDMLQPLEAAVATALILGLRRVLELRRRGDLARWEALVSMLLLAPYVLAGLTSYGCHIGVGCPSL